MKINNLKKTMLVLGCCFLTNCFNYKKNKSLNYSEKVKNPALMQKLCLALKKCDISQVAKAVKQGADLNEEVELFGGIRPFYLQVFIKAADAFAEGNKETTNDTMREIALSFLKNFFAIADKSSSGWSQTLFLYLFSRTDIKNEDKLRILDSMVKIFDPNIIFTIKKFKCDTALSFAIINNNIPLFYWLVNHGANIHYILGGEASYIYFSTMVCNAKITKYLVDNGAPIKLPQEEIDTILDYIDIKMSKELRRGFEEFINQAFFEIYVKGLLEAEFTVKTILTQLKKEITSYIQEKKEFLSFINPKTLSRGLEKKSSKSDEAIVDQMLERPTPLLMDYEAYAELTHFAATEGFMFQVPILHKLAQKTEKLKCILPEPGSKKVVTLGNDDGTTAVSIAIDRDNLSFIYYFITAQNVNFQNLKGESPLHLAVKAAKLNLIIRFLFLGADPNLQDNLGNTALHLAAALEDPNLSSNIVKFLISRNAKLLKNKSGMTALDLAIKLNHTETIKLLS